MVLRVRNARVLLGLVGEASKVGRVDFVPGRQCSDRKEVHAVRPRPAPSPRVGGGGPRATRVGVQGRNDPENFNEGNPRLRDPHADGGEDLRGPVRQGGEAVVDASLGGHAALSRCACGGGLVLARQTRKGGGGVDVFAADQHCDEFAGAITEPTGASDCYLGSSRIVKTVVMLPNTTA